MKIYAPSSARGSQPRRASFLAASLITFGSLGLLWLCAHPAQKGTLVNIAQNPQLIGRYFRYRAQVAALPELTLDLKYKYSYQLQQHRQTALAQGRIAPAAFVPAQLSLGGEPMPVEMRLKPGSIRDLKQSQWPYQIKIGNEDRPFGMERFSLYSPFDKAFWAEELWLGHLRQEGLMTRGTQLARFSINGGIPQLVVVEDGSTHELITAHERPEGLLLNYRESPEEATFEVKVPRSGRVAQDFGLRRQQAWAIAQLAAFRAGDRAAREVFDLEATATFLAIASLWPDAQALHSPLSTFYYNPSTARLEPVGFHAAAHPPAQADASLSQWVRQLLQDPQFQARYRHERQRLTQPAYLTQLQQTLSADLRPQQHVLQPAVTAAETDQLWDGLLARAAQGDPLLAAAQNDPRGESSDLSAATLVRFSQAPSEAPFPAAVALDGPAPRLSAESSASADDADDAGADVYDWAAGDLSSPALSELLAQHPFLSWDEPSKTLTAQRGRWQVAGDLIIPPGLRLVVPAGTELAFEPHALLIARGPLEFQGTPGSPVVLKPQGDRWGGVELWQVNQRSLWRHVSLFGAQAGVLAYQSPLKLTGCQLVGGPHSQEGLRLIHSPFEIVNSAFEQILDDAVDTEMAEGILTHSTFSHIGGDGIDLSGAQVNLRNLHLSDIGDRAISAGQNSLLLAESITVDKAAIALSSLDGASILLHGLQARALSEVALTAYRKRWGFGPASILAQDLSTDPDVPQALAQTNSQITLEDTLIAGSDRSDYELRMLKILSE